MKKIIPYLVSALVVFIALYNYNQKSESQNLRSQDFVVGISPDYPPYAQIDLETGKIVGLEVDVVNEIAQRLHKKLVIKDMPFGSLIIELIAGQIDAIAAGLTPTPERKKNVLFSTAYINNDHNLALSKKSCTPITSLEDLYEKRVAVCIGYTADTYLSQYPKINLIRLKTPSDGFIALQSDSVDVFVIAESIFTNFTQMQKNESMYQVYTLPSSADDCALAYAKFNKNLQAQIDPIIEDMIKDGTMLTIKKKWGFA